MPRSLRALTESDVHHFLEHNYIKMENAFSPETAAEWVGDAFKRAGWDMQKPETFPEGITFMGRAPGVSRRMDVREFSPRVYDAVCDLLGGEDRIAPPYQWNDGFVLNYKCNHNEPWNPPNHTHGSWHVDGDFNHYLDSPEIGLFVLIIWTDIPPRGGATAVALDSIAPLARRIVDNPWGLGSKRLSRDINTQCRKFLLTEAKAGTVYLMHPFMLHSVSQNHSGLPRCIANHHARLSEPMRFDRENADDFSVVEVATLKALGVEKLRYPPPPPERRFRTDHDPDEPLGKVKTGG